MSTRRAAAAVVATLLVLLLAGCQLQATVGATVADDGSGTISVAVGLDAKALERVGNPDRVLRLDDLRAVGWEVTPAERRPDGTTWVRATRRFASPPEVAGIMASLHPTAFQGFALTKDEGLGGTTWTFAGTIDLTRGIDTFADPQLTAALGGDAFGGQVGAIEAAEGRKVADMVGFTLTVELPGGQPQSFTPKLGDPAPLPVSVTATQRGPIPLPIGPGASGSLGTLVVLGGLGTLAVALTVLRRRFKAVAR